MSSEKPSFRFRVVVIQTLLRHIWELIHENKAFEPTSLPQRHLLPTSETIKKIMKEGVGGKDDFGLILTGPCWGLMTILFHYLYIRKGEIAYGGVIALSDFVRILEAATYFLEIKEDFLTENAQEESSKSS